MSTRKDDISEASTGAAVHNSTRREGGQPGNGNAKKGMVLPDLKLGTGDEVLRFMREILIPYTLSGEIGTRQSSAITTAVKVLLDYESLQELEKRVAQLEGNKESVKN